MRELVDGDRIADGLDHEQRARGDQDDEQRSATTSRGETRGVSLAVQPSAPSARSISCLKLSVVCAPLSRRPLMKKVGVELTPRVVASFVSACTASIVCLPSRHSWNLPTS